LLKRYFDLYNEIAEKYSESKIVYLTPEGRKRYRIIGRILQEGWGLTLDVGCGDGVYKQFIDAYVGLDPAKASLLRFKGIRIRGIAQKLPFKANVFDRVLLSEVLEHIFEREEVLREIWRVLKLDGQLIVSVPYGSEPFRLTFPQKLHEAGVAPRIYLHGAFPIDYLKSLLECCRFKVKIIMLLDESHLIAIARNKG